MPIAFDEGAADNLIKAAVAAADRLRGQDSFRREAADTAADEFSGTYARLLADACTIESADRVRLAGVLEDLAAQVGEAKTKAEDEKERSAQLAAWHEREDTRRAEAATTPQVALGLVFEVPDPMPSEVPIAPPTISAAFSPRQHTRTAGAGAEGKSSADPDHLRTFVSQTRASNTGIEQELSRVRNAWFPFTGSCSWVPFGATSFLGGFEELISESEADAAWIDQIAVAFETAGGGSLSNDALHVASSAAFPMSDAQLLEMLGKLSATELATMLQASPRMQSQLRRLPPAKIHEWWVGMNPPDGAEGTFSDRQLGLLAGLPVLFGNLEGLPYGARHHANDIALTAAITDLETELAGLNPSPVGNNYTYAQRYADLQSRLDALQNIRGSLNSPKGGAERFLISLTEDQPPLAAISIGDLDTATSVSYAVPGMGTTTKAMSKWTDSAQMLHSQLPPGSAVVSWVGYEAPPSPFPSFDFGVLDSKRAVAGGQSLAAALRGLSAVRAGSLPQTNVVAHSYGTTTAAAALTQAGVQVDNFITLGSAGLPNSVGHASELNATNVYSGHARDVRPGSLFAQGDQWAWTGREGSGDHKINPISPGFGAQAFGTDTRGDAGSPVTDHGVSVEGNGSGYLDHDTESLRNVVRVIKGETEKLTPHMPDGPPDWREVLKRAL